MSACDDHVDFIRPGLHRAANFIDALPERRKSGGKTGRDRSHVDPAALDRPASRLHKRVIDAHRRNLNPEALHPKFLREFLLNRLPRLRAQAPHALVGVIAGKRGQVHTGDGAKQPSGLPFLLHRSPRDQRLRAALDRAGIHAHRVNPIQIERDAAVGLQVAPGVLRNGGVGRRDRTRHSNGKPVGI